LPLGGVVALLVALLKFDTRMSPGLSGPPAGKPSGTNATPYGFWSPFDATVDTSRKPAGRKLRLSSAIAWMKPDPCPASNNPIG